MRGFINCADLEQQTLSEIRVLMRQFGSECKDEFACTNTKTSYNICYFLLLTSTKIPTSYWVTLKLTSKRKTNVTSHRNMGDRYPLTSV